MNSLEIFKEKINKKIQVITSNNGNQLEKLRARIEIVREGIFISPSDQTLERGLSLLVSDVTKLLHSENDINSISEKELSVVTSLCNSLIEINEFTSKNNRTMYFSSQRYLFDIASYLFAHPNYTELFDFTWNVKEVDRVEITQILYGLAEKQNMNPRPSGDVTSEGEFCGNIFNGYLYKSKNLGYNSDGLRDAFKLWKDLCSSAAEINTTRLKALFINLRDSATHNFIHDINQPYIYPEPDWFQDWLSLFLTLKPSIYSFQDYQNAYKSLNGIPADGKWAKFSAESVTSDYKQLHPLEMSDIYSACIQATALESIGHMFGVIALYNRWNELKECWYSSQPSDADAHFCSHEFFNRKLPAFCQWMVVSVSNDNGVGFFIDRHSLNRNIFKTCVVLIAEELNLVDISVLPMPRGTLSEIQGSKAVVRKLIENIEMVEDINVGMAFDWGESRKDVREKVDRILGGTLENLEESYTKSLSKCIPNNECSEDLELKYEAWEKTNNSFLSQFNPVAWGDSIIAKTNLDGMNNLTFERDNVGAAYYLSKKSGQRLYDMQFGGRQLAMKLQQRIGSELQHIAQNFEGVHLKDMGNIFISNIDWDKYAFNRKNEILNRSSSIIRGDFLHSFIVTPGSIELKIFQWPDMPWSTENNPVVVYGFLDINKKIESNSSVYYKINIINPSGIKRINF